MLPAGKRAHAKAPGAGWVGQYGQSTGWGGTHGNVLREVRGNRIMKSLVGRLKKFPLNSNSSKEPLKISLKQENNEVQFVSQETAQAAS